MYYKISLFSCNGNNMSKLAVSVATLIVFVSLMITLVWAIVWKPGVTTKGRVKKLLLSKLVD